MFTFRTKLDITSGIVSILIFALTKGQSNPLHDVTQLIDAQIDFLENTVNFVGHVVANVSTFIEKTLARNNSKQVTKKMELLQEKMDEIKLRPHYLLHQKTNLLKRMVNHVFPGFEFNFTVEDEKQIAKEFDQHLTECKYVIFNYMPNAFLELAKDINVSLDEKDDDLWERMTGTSKKRFEESILKWSEEYGLGIPLMLHKVMANATTIHKNETM